MRTTAETTATLAYLPHLNCQLKPATRLRGDREAYSHSRKFDTYTSAAK
jgi:hypothetical protein